MSRFLIGIDEAGRGPLAGPVSVGAVLLPIDFDYTLVAGAKDSKQMTPKAREEMYTLMEELMNKGLMRFAVGVSSARQIDTHGIVPSIKAALKASLLKLEADPALCKVLLDGGLKAPKEYLFQETIIKGDAKEPCISLASIVAKVHRDRLMIGIAPEYPNYHFEVHKGYGTKKHIQAIAEFGLSAIHRKSFCRAFTSP